MLYALGKLGHPRQRGMFISHRINCASAIPSKPASPTVRQILSKLQTQLFKLLATRQLELVSRSP